MCSQTLNEGNMKSGNIWNQGTDCAKAKHWGRKSSRLSTRIRFPSTFNFKPFKLRLLGQAEFSQMHPAVVTGNLSPSFLRDFIHRNHSLNVTITLTRMFWMWWINVRESISLSLKTGPVAAFILLLWEDDDATQKASGTTWPFLSFLLLLHYPEVN